MIHYFGLGFIQLKIDDDLRFHFYTEALPSIMPVEEVHNHRYDFTSVVLKGELHYEYYMPTEGNDHIIRTISCDPNNPAPDDAKECGLMHICSGNYKAGCTYNLNKDTFHRVWARENTITKLYRAKLRRDFAQAVKHKDEINVCPFSKQIPEKELWEIVEQMI